MGDFDLHTRISDHHGVLRADLREEWGIWGPNGGYLAAIALRAAGRVAKLARPVTLHVHYQRVARFAPVTLDVDVLRAGRNAESIAVKMLQDDKPVLDAMVRTAQVVDGVEHDLSPMPEVAQPESCPREEDVHDPARHGPLHRFWKNFERRVLIAEAWDLPRPKLRPDFRQWLRFRDEGPLEDPFLDAGRAALLIDTMCWPAAWLHHTDDRYIAPSLDLSVWFHRLRPRSDWLFVQTQAPIAEGGIVHGHGRVFSRNGELLASGGSQLLCTPAPAP